jgi:hypothetical protein
MVEGILLKFLASTLCLLPQRAFPGTSAKGNSATPAPAISWHTAGEITLPFEYFRQHIYVTLSINGKPGFIFMLDSGANRNILNLRSARQLGIKPRMAQEKDIGFGDGRIYVGPEESVNAEMGSLSVASTMSVMDLNRFEQHFHHPTDGLLGYPFFRQFVVKVDFQRKLLTLSPANQFSYRGLGIKIPLRPSKDFAVMPVIVGSGKYSRHEINVVADTGSNVTLMLYEHFIHPLDLDSSLSHAQPGEAYGLNGYYAVARGSVDLLQIGTAETRNLATDYMRNDEEVGPTRDIPGAIGNGILQSFQVVIFDVPHRRIIFELKPPPWQPGLERTETAEP